MRWRERVRRALQPRPKPAPDVLHVGDVARALGAPPEPPRPGQALPREEVDRLVINRRKPYALHGIPTAMVEHRTMNSFGPLFEDVVCPCGWSAATRGPGSHSQVETELRFHFEHCPKARVAPEAAAPEACAHPPEAMDHYINGSRKCWACGAFAHAPDAPLR